MFKQSHNRICFALVAIGLLTVLMGGCSFKPDSALCGRYYSQIAGLSASSHPAIASALRTGAGKQAVIDHCLGLARSQAECTVNAGSLAEATDCEGADRKNIFERYLDR